MRRIFVLAVAAAACVTAVPTSAQAGERLTVVGSWQSLVNCVFTSYDPTSTRMSCVGSTLWTGSLEGVTKYDVTGRYDVLTGTSSGVLHEVFYGRDQAGNQGTLVFDETYTLDGPTSTIHIDCAAVGGTDAFAGARGHLVFDGTDNVATGFGQYGGTLVLPKAST